MDDDGLLRVGTPYTTVRTLIAWANYRRGYIRGRALLGGVDLDDVTLTDYINVTEAILIEPAVHAGQSVDETLNQIEKNILEASAEELVAQGRGEEVFETEEWRRRGATLEEMFPPVMPDEEHEDLDLPEGDLFAADPVEQGAAPAPTEFKPSSFLPHLEDDDSHAS